MSLEIEDLDSSSYDSVDEKEVTNGAAIAIDDSLTHLVFSMSSIMDSEIHMPDLSHLVHASPLDGAQPNDFQDACLAKSSPSSVLPLTILDPMHFCSSSFVLGTHSQSLHEYFGHHYLYSSHTSTIEYSLPVYSHETTVVFICDLLDSLEARSTHGSHSFTLFDPMPSLCSYKITSTHPLCVNEDGDIIHSGLIMTTLWPSIIGNFILQQILLYSALSCFSLDKVKLVN